MVPLEYKIASESINENMFVATAYPGTEMFKHPKVQSMLNSNFKINFNTAGEPIMDGDGEGGYQTPLP